MNRWAIMLAEMPATAQRLIARHQRVSLPRQCPADERLRRIRVAICRSTAVRAIYLTLAPAERAAVQELRQLRGGIRPSDLEERYGALRPWSQLADDPTPRTISERLALLGWLIPRPDAPRNPAHLLLPPELRRWLPRPLELATLGPAPAEPPAAPALIAATALLVAAADRPLELRNDGRLRAETLRRLGLPAPALNFTVALLLQLGLLSAHAGKATPGPTATAFLNLSPVERLARLRDAWVGLLSPDPWVVALPIARHGIDWPTLRRRLIAWAEALPAHQLVAEDGLFTQLRAAFGPLADAHTHGFRAVRRVPWGDRRAEQVWTASIDAALGWLGLLARAAGAPQALYRPEPPEPTTGWSYDGPGELDVPHTAPAGDLLALAPALTVECISPQVARYRLDLAGLARTVASGRRLPDVRDLLRHHTGPEPPTWLDDAAWSPPTVTIAPVLLVQSEQPAALERAARQRTVRRRLSRRLAPGLALVNPENSGALARALGRQGLAVMQGTGSREQGAGAGPWDSELPPGTRAALLLACAFFRQNGPANATLQPPAGLEERLRAGLPAALRAATDAALHHLALPAVPAADPTPWEPAAPPEPAAILTSVPQPAPGDMRTALRQAIAAKRTLTLRYRDAAGAEAARTVRPLEMYRQGDRWYLTAHCALAGEVRTFRVDRMLEITSASRRAVADIVVAGLSRHLADADHLGAAGRAGVDLVDPHAIGLQVDQVA